MAFWGVELKPKKPFGLQAGGEDEEGGRLLLTRATLGIGGPRKGRAMVEYKVGSREPIPLCTLIPNVRESCPLKVLFNEKEDVVFFVVGDRSVHVTGFHVDGRKRHIDKEDENDHNGNFIDLVSTESESDDNDKGKEKDKDNNFIDLVVVDTESESDSEQSESDEDCGAALELSPNSKKKSEERKRLLLAIRKYPNFFGKKTSGGNAQKAFK